MARPSAYTPAICEQITALLAEGKSLREICAEPGMPSRSTVHSWVANDVQGFAAKYAAAKAVGMDQIADEILAIADDSSRDTIRTESGERPDNEWIARSKLRVDSRKWLLAKLAPKKYGERQAIDISNSDGSLQLDEVLRAARMAALLQIAAARKAADDGSDLA